MTDSTGPQTESLREVLLVEDDDATSYVIARVLEPRFRVIRASTASEGITRAARGGIGAALIDVVLPDMRGTELCRALRREPSLERIPVVLITGLIDPATEQEAFAAGCTEFLQKPVDVDLLPARVEALLALADRQREHDALARMQDRERFASDLLGRVAEGVFVVDPAWRFTYLNAEAERLLRHRGDELLGQSLWEKFPDATRTPLYMRAFRAMESGRDDDFELWFAPFQAWFHLRLFPSKRGLVVHVVDVLARRELDERVHLLETAVERGSDAVVISTADADGVPLISYTNAAFTAQTGWSLEEIRGQSVEMLLADGNDPEALAQLWGGARRREPVRMELLHRTKSGGAYWAELDLQPVQGRRGEHHLVGLKRDVTKRKLAEKALKERELFYRQLFECSPVPMWLYDPDNFKILAVNDAAVQAYGYSREEFTTLSLLDLRPAEGHDLLRQYPRRGLSSRVRSRHRWKSGELRDIEVTVFDVDFNGRTARCAVLWDVTERIQAQATQARLAALVEDSEDAIIGTTIDGVIHSWNAAAERMFGWTSAEATGKPVESLVPEMLVDTERQLLARVRRGERVAHMITLRKHRSGTCFPVSVSISPVRDVNGTITGFASIVRDMSRQQDLEAQLRQAQKMEAVGQLASGVAHDFNNLLAVIKSSAQLLRDELPQSAPGLAEEVHEILSSVDRAVGVTRQLLAFSRKQVLELRYVDIADVVANMAKLLSRVMAGRIELLVGASGPCPVRADPGLIEQVLLNLAVNARDAMPQGGKLRIHAERRPQGPGTPAELAAGPAVVMEVADTGTGMDSATLGRIFEPFFTTKPKGKGTGLGLSMVYGIVQQSGGVVTVESTPGQGTTFRVWLPVCEGEREADVADTAPTPAPRSSPATVLVADDEDGVRAALRRLLVRHGYRVLEARSGTEALEIWRGSQQSIDVLVTDIVMPGIEGPALVERLRELNSELPVVMLTGFAEMAELPAESERLALVHKPFDIHELLATLQRVLEPRSSGA